jgi:hypothetical protein
MTISLSLPPELEAKLRQRAADAGKDMATFVRDAIEEKLSLPRTFAEILAPIHQATMSTGMTEAELDVLIEDARDENYARKRT